TLSCVRGQVNSITVVFQDGTVRTLPGAGQNTHGIGWLSDENGIPCISGERKSNAATYLPTLFALSAMHS
ncbi:TIGR03752 family integrating conjugative element protein, partial [Xenorhabdus sp. Flor]|nr:TIGR03752 family integrating conjugative element protein [Xenorhabdus sp. Flor]